MSAFFIYFGISHAVYNEHKIHLEKSFLLRFSFPVCIITAFLGIHDQFKFRAALN